MKNAKLFVEALCYCNKEIPREFLREYYERKWAKLQMKEAGFESVFINPQPPKVEKSECCKCGKGIILDKKTCGLQQVVANGIGNS